ncbi:toxin-antitoxin system toxin component HicA family [Candidatus Gastranaerophilus sp. (ex Termes propinquus)]|nr:toxin-antitoxin system toxin component HicA family [Candidatus Gastranaerophilus sp. (ex Termes propinquus)]
MSKRDKLIQKIMTGKNVSYTEASRVLIDLGYIPKQTSGGSSHITFRKNECEKIVLIQTQNPVKPYIIKQIQEALNGK